MFSVEKRSTRNAEWKPVALAPTVGRLLSDGAHAGPAVLWQCFLAAYGTSPGQHRLLALGDIEVARTDPDVAARHAQRVWRIDLLASSTAGPERHRFDPAATAVLLGARNDVDATRRFRHLVAALGRHRRRALMAISPATGQSETLLAL